MYIYCIENLINYKKYIGCTVNYKNRKNYHICSLNANNHSNKFLQSDWNLMGKINFSFYILEEFFEVDSEEKEIFWISKINSKIPNGYNMTDGGKGISNYKFKLESNEIRSKSMSGKDNSLYGRKVADSSSKYFGVYKHEKKNWKYIYYIVKMVVNKKQIWIGSFKDELSAAIAYDDYCWNIYHDLNHLNFPERFIEKK